MRALDFIDRKVASIYLNNYDGVNEEKIQANNQKYDLPKAHVRFGDYNSAGITKDNTVYFWTVTS